MAERFVRPASVVVLAPGLDRPASFGERLEDMLVEALVAEAAVEAFDEGVLRRLPWLDVVQAYSMRSSPRKHRKARHLRAVVHDDRLRIPAIIGDPIEHGSHPGAADRRIDFDRE